MDLSALLLQYEKRNEILDNKNSPVNTAVFVKKIREEQKIKPFYLNNADIWLSYYHLHNKKNPRLSFVRILRKYFDLLILASFFSKKEWPEIYIEIKKYENIIYAK